MTEYEYTNPVVAVPVAAVNLLNKVIGVLGDSMTVMVLDQEISGHGYVQDASVHVEWEDKVPEDLMTRVEAAVDEINATIAAFPLIGICEGDGQSLHLFIRTE
jgi:hypothetical protein